MSKAVVKALRSFYLAVLPEVHVILEFFWKSELRAASLFWAVKQHVFIIAGNLAEIAILFYGSWCYGKETMIPNFP